METALRRVAGKSPTAFNRLGLDYEAEAARLGGVGGWGAGAGGGGGGMGIIDVHTHVSGRAAPAIYDRARRLYGVTRTYTMTMLPLAAAARDALGDSLRFIAFPTFSDPDRGRAHRAGYLEAIEVFHREYGARMLKIWNSPRLRDHLSMEGGGGWVDVAEVDSPWRVRACEVGERLGMMYMVHIADPDTWFATKYADAERYGVKRDHYHGLERMLDRFGNPWIAAHMGGWPEDLEFLDGLLTRHPNLHLDTSATKWVVRALSGHPVERVRGFFEKWVGGGRLLFGSDLVVNEDHVSASKNLKSPMSDLASSPEEAYELYCSRYWALRTIFETDYQGESNIADPDLMMVDPARHDAMSAPVLRGIGLRGDLLKMLYHGAAAALVERWWAEHS